MAGQTIGFGDRQVYHKETVRSPNAEAQHIFTEPPFDRAHGTNLHVMAAKIDERGDKHQSNAPGALNRMSRFATVAELFASIVDQLNSPLTSMDANAQAARRWLAPGLPNLTEAIASIDRITRETRAVAETVERIREIYKQEFFNRKEAGIPDLIKDAVRLVSEDPGKREVPIEFHFDENLPKVYVDPLAIREVLINVIQSAKEAMAHTESPLVEVWAASTDQGEILVQVIENGTGISHKEEIFDLFVANKENGLRTGLAVSRSIAEAHGGRLWSEINRSGGATFCLALPLCTRSHASVGA